MEQNRGGTPSLFSACWVCAFKSAQNKEAKNFLFAYLSDFARHVSVLRQTATTRLSFISSFFALYFTLFKCECTLPSCACVSVHGGGGCNKLQFFRVCSGIQNQACTEEPLTTRPPLPFLLFLAPHSLSPFLAQRESLEKKRGFYSASLCAPRHSQAFWNPSMPCQGAPRVQLALCEDFLSAAAPLPLLLQWQRGRTVFSRGFPVTTGCNN